MRAVLERGSAIQSAQSSSNCSYNDRVQYDFTSMLDRDPEHDNRAEKGGAVREERLIGPSEIVVPRRFRRMGRRGFRWEIPRSFPGYFADTDKQVLGASTKYVIRSDASTAPQYLIKYAQKHGRRETLTEFFINRLGLALGLKMAHSGLVLADGEPTFLTRIFTSESETLRHGSLIIEDCFKRAQALDANELEGIQRRSEQEFYSIDFVTSVVKDFCGDDFEVVFGPLIEMLVFDALIGSMDRHSQNWGVLGRTVEPVSYRFAPIFDTARALLWSLDETQILKLESDPVAFRSHIEKARPCMGPVRNHPKVNKCNHFEFVENLMDLYPIPATAALKKLSNGVGPKAAGLLRKYPFRSGFTRDRKRLIIKILEVRAERLMQILAKGGA